MNNSAPAEPPLDARNILNHVISQIYFIQTITVRKPDDELSLHSEAVCGLYYTLDNVIDKLNEIARQMDEGGNNG
ncbi:hypothetical protein SAMN05216428_11284 [Nitrosospira sp. Nsp11]|uniref:hypothetical protein n=1 Tax=Nitrosospira sp. Nsp11 TaxID=1855338 RepID=UPI000910A7EA|nr:hypothetical protein [Nitrosospira sp. Nsp11]SHM05301.1 hypothetical protein SAMN05216428_11284 [Nitrosospira sp. Nsp11]